MLYKILSDFKREEMSKQSSTIAAFELSWNSLDPLAQKLGCLLSLLSSSPIPWELAKKILRDEEISKLIDSENLEESRSNLVKLYLLNPTANDSYIMQNITRQLFQDKLNISAEANVFKRAIGRSIATIAKQNSGFINNEDYVEIDPIISHIEEIATTLIDFLEEDDLAWIFVSLVKFYNEKSAYDDEEYWYEQCLPIIQKYEIENCSSLYDILKCLSDIKEEDVDHRRQANEKIERTRTKIEETAVALKEFLNYEDVIFVFIGLGNFYESQGIKDRALFWYEQCLPIVKESESSSTQERDYNRENFDSLDKELSTSNRDEEKKVKEAKLDEIIAEMLNGKSSNAYTITLAVQRYLKQFHLFPRVEPYEVIHEAYLRAKKFIDNGGNINNHKAWIKGTTFNIIREKSRKLLKQYPTDPQSKILEASNLSNENSISIDRTDENLKGLWEALDILRDEDPETTKLITWKLVEGLSWKDIQERLIQEYGEAPSEAALRQRASRAKRKLRRLFHSIEN